MAKFSMRTELPDETFVSDLRKHMAEISKETPTIEAFIFNELGLTKITDDDFLSLKEKSLENMDFSRVRGNTCLQQGKVLTYSDEVNLFNLACKYK